MPPATNEASNHEMKVHVDKSQFLQELSITQGVVGRKSTVPILSHFLFETLGNNLMITATDLDVSLRTLCPAHVVMPGSCTIPARRLHDYVRLFGSGEVTIETLENDRVRIRSGRSNTKMVGLRRKDFPNLALYPAESAIALPKKILRTMIDSTIFAISALESRYTLDGALLILRPESIAMVATDGHRLAHVESATPLAGVTSEVKLVVPSKALSEIYSLLGLGGIDVFEFARDESTLFFRIGTRLLTCRQVAGSFPNYEAVMPRDYTKSFTVPKADFLESIQRVSQFSDERSHAIRLEVGKNQLRLSSSNPDSGESDEQLETAYSGDLLGMRLKSEYLLEFLRAADSENVTFAFKDPSAAAELQPATNGDCRYRYVVMPMRA